MSPMRFKRVRWLVLGSSVALVVSCGSSTGSRTLGADAQPPSRVPSASAKNDTAVRNFIEGLRRERVAFEPAAEWSTGRLILAVSHPRSAPWPGLAGQVIGGLEVTVLRATVSTRDYRRAIPAIGQATFTDRDRVESFNYPTDGSHIIVRVRGLRDMDAARRAALTTKLERIADVPVHVVNAPHYVPLTYIGKR
jgi:hypothetical protein